MRTQRQITEYNIDEGLRCGGEFDMDSGKLLGDSRLGLEAQGLGGGALIDGHGTLLWLDFPGLFPVS